MRRRGLIVAAALLASAVPSLLTAIGARTPLKLESAFARLPLSFEANRGQFDSRVQFVARGAGYSVFLTQGEAVIDLRRDVIRMRLVGASKNPAIAGVAPLPGRSNYYRTRVPTGPGVHGLFDGGAGARFENVPIYASVRYANVYRGVDLIYRGNQRQLEYDLVIAPGADPIAIRLAFDGVKAVKLSDDGELILQAAGGEIRQHRPVIYQDVNGIRKKIDGGYALAGLRQVTFNVGDYDRSRPLIIDPTITYGTYLGGGSSDFAKAIAVDASGNAYITGQTQSTDFPLQPPDPQPITAGHYNLFVAKVNSTGTSLLYSTYFDNDPMQVNYNIGNGIKVDAGGDAYVTGQFGATVDQTLIMRLDGGGLLKYGLAVPGGNENWGNGIAIDGAGNAYLTGIAGSGFFVTAGAYQTTEGGANDAFVAKFNTNGMQNETSIVYSTFLGGSSRDEGHAIAIDGSGNAYVTGQTTSSNFPVTAGAFQSSYGGDLSDVFVAKLSADGHTLMYSTLFGGDNFEAGYAIAIDLSGYAYIAGYVDFTGLPTTQGAFQTAWTNGDCRVNFGDPPTPCGDAFAAKFNPSASGAASLIYSTYLGSSGLDIANAVALDGAGNLYVAGSVVGKPYTPPGPFPTVNPISGFNSTNSTGFIARLNAAGSALLFSTYYTDAPNGMALDGSSALFVAGGTFSMTGIATTGVYQTMNHGADDAFITKISGFPVPPTITTNPQSQTIAPGQTASMSVVASGPGPLTYQWYVGASGTTSSPIGGATGTSYTTPALTSTTRYWVRVTNTSDSADSLTATITVTFTDDPLVSFVSVVRAIHINELRTRVATLRSRYGLSIFTWTTDPTLTAGTIIRAQHILSLRTALQDVYDAAGRTRPTYADPSLAAGTVVKKAHVADLRSAVSAIE